MTWHVVRLNEVAPTPWRNAGGNTRELLAWPDSAAWRWRASVAEVVRAGPFSIFTGVQRWFAVLEGDGVCLTTGGCRQTLVKGDAPLAFDGAVPTGCELLGGATQDFNLMVRGGAPARMLRVSGAFQMVTNASKIVAVYAHKEKATVQIGSEIHELLLREFGWIRVQGISAIKVLGSDALLMEIDI